MTPTLRSLGLTLVLLGTAGAVAQGTSTALSTDTAVAKPDMPDKPVSGLDLGSSR